MTAPTTLSRIRREIEHMLSLGTGDVNSDTTKLDLFTDSLDELEIVMRIEEEFGLEIPDDDCAKWKTVGDICAYVEMRMKECR